MKFAYPFAAIALSIGALSTPIAALAHARVVASTPAEGATIAKPRTVSLTFSEALLPENTAAAIVMTAMPGVENHGDMQIRNFTSEWSADKRTLTLSLRQPLRTGTYEVRWQSAGTDGHRMTGIVNFIVN